jgi:tetratricopeptide (TPR) repeat protein
LDREAFGLFARALDQDPENLSALHESARLAYLIGSFEEAAGRMRTYLMYHPGDIDILFSLAGLLYKAKCCDEARDAIERVMALSPDYEGAGELLRLISEETALGEGSPSAPQTTSARADKEAARLLKEAGRFDEALSIYVKLLDERDRSVLADMGDCLANLGRVDDAAESYREALREDIGDAKAMIGLGVANILRNRPEEAESFLTRALTIDPGNSKALSGLGMAQNLQGKRPEAFDCFRRALDADPEQLAALNGLVGCSFELQRFAEAERHLTTYLMYHPADLDMLFSLAGVQYKMGKPSNALDNIEKVLLFEPCYQGGRELMDRIREQTAA